MQSIATSVNEYIASLLGERQAVAKPRKIIKANLTRGFEGNMAIVKNK